MNFHLVSDNPIYIDSFIERADRLSAKINHYIVLKESREVKNINSKKVVSSNIKNALEIFKRSKCNKVFIHFLNNEAIEFINKINSDIPVYWMFWGADGYRHPKLQSKVHLSETKRLLNSLKPASDIKTKLKKKYSEYLLTKKLNKAFSRIDYCCTQVKGDFELIKSISTNFNMKHKYFSYRGVEDISYPESVTSKNKINVLLGNSANPSNNHLEAIRVLSDYRGTINKIICPLSYSGPLDYIDIIIKEGHNYFGDKFQALTEFVPFEEYLTLLETIDVGVFYHVRQQGYSNTVELICQGKKIFMNSRSPLLKMYLDFEVKNVFSDFESLLKTPLVPESGIKKTLGENIIDSWYKDLLDN